METHWAEDAAAAAARFADGEARVPVESDERQRQLTRMGNAAWAAGLSLLMSGDEAGARSWLVRAAETYRRSWDGAPPESWGRPIASLKARLVAGDLDGAESDAHWALDAGATASPGPIGRYAAVLALLVLGDDVRASELTPTLQSRDDFPQPVADALAALAGGDSGAYDTAVRSLLADFAQREEFLEDVRVADTVLALQALAGQRGLAVPLASPLLPG